MVLGSWYAFRFWFETRMEYYSVVLSYTALESVADMQRQSTCFQMISFYCLLSTRSQVPLLAYEGTAKTSARLAKTATNHIWITTLS